MTPARRAALRKAQLASAAKRRGTGKASSKKAQHGSQKYVVLYHHTSRRNARRIVREGLRSKRSSGKVYLTNLHRNSYYRPGGRSGSSYPGESRAVVKVKIPKAVYEKKSMIDFMSKTDLNIPRNERTKMFSAKDLKGVGVQYSIAPKRQRRRRRAKR
jgi:hypothetical protein